MIPGGGLSSVPVPGTFLPPDDQLPVTNPNPDPDGPTIPTDWELGGIALNDPSQGLEVQVWTFYLAGETIMVKPANGPAVAFYVAGPGVTELTGSFDSNMNPILAFIADGTTWLWWWNSLISGYQLSSLPAMTSPRLTLDDKRATQDGARSVLLFYIRDGQVCYRQSSERYQTEYQLYPVPAGFVALSRVGMADNRRVQIELRSNWIPPSPGPGPGPCVGVPVDATGCNNADWCLPLPPPPPVWTAPPAGAPDWSLPPPCTPVDWAPVPPWEPTMPCDHPPVTIPLNQFTYISINGETQVLTPGAVQLVAHTTGVLPIDRGGTGAVNAEAARISLGLGTAATADANAFATASQGALATSAVQPGNDAAVLGSGAAIPAGYSLLADGAGGADWGSIPASIATNTTFYIATTGNDSTGDGSITKPWLTLAKAFVYLNGKSIATGVAVTIDIGAGSHNWTGTLAFSHPYGKQIFITGATPANAITGIVQADFTAPLTPVPGTRGAYDLYNSAGMLATNANSAARTAARATDATQNLTLLRSVYLTRIVSAGAQFELVFLSPCGGMKDILLENGQVRVLSDSSLDIATSLAFTGGVTAALTATSGGFISGTHCIVANSGVGVVASDNATIRLRNLTIQGCGVDGIQALQGGNFSLFNTRISGCGSRGIMANMGGNISVNTDEAVQKILEISGHGMFGMVLTAFSSFTWSGTGFAGDTIKVQGSASSQLTLRGASFVFISSTGTTLTIQASSTAEGLSALTGSQMMILVPTSINAGNDSVRAQTTGTVLFTAALTITDSVAPVLQRPFSADNGRITIRSTMSLPATLGALGVSATNGGLIVESQSVLLGLSATVPTKFTPPLGQLSSQNSMISSGPATTAALVMLATAVTLKGSAVKIDALAGAGTRAVHVQADGTLVAV